MNEIYRRISSCEHLFRDTINFARGDISHPQFPACTLYSTVSYNNGKVQLRYLPRERNLFHFHDTIIAVDIACGKYPALSTVSTAV
jgi:hypothetical protein